MQTHRKEISCGRSIIQYIFLVVFLHHILCNLFLYSYNNNNEKLILRLKMLAQTQGHTHINNVELGTELMSLQHNLES